MATVQQADLLAGYAHSAWAAWVGVLVQAARVDGQGRLFLPPALLARWLALAATPFDQLSPAEQTPARREAAKILALIQDDFSGDLGPGAEQARERVIAGLQSGALTLEDACQILDLSFDRVLASLFA